MNAVEIEQALSDLALAGISTVKEIKDNAIAVRASGRRFKNDTERLEKLFELYTKMMAAEAKGAPKMPARRATKRANA